VGLRDHCPSVRVLPSSRPWAVLGSKILGERCTGPEDREGCVRRNEVNENNILRSHLCTSGWLQMLMTKCFYPDFVPCTLAWKNSSRTHVGREVNSVLL
jgi:hypothetical protein